MKNYAKKVKANCISGVVFLLPVLILFVLIQKVFGVFAKFGHGIAKITGLDLVLGKNAANFIGAFILLFFVYFCGFLVRLAFFKKISDGIDAKLKQLIPGYEKRKAIAKNQLLKGQKVETDLPILVKTGDFWQPGYLIEKDNLGNAVVTVEVGDGKQIYIVSITDVKVLEKTSLSELKAIINASGQGLLACK